MKVVESHMIKVPCLVAMNLSHHFHDNLILPKLLQSSNKLSDATAELNARMKYMQTQCRTKEMQLTHTSMLTKEKRARVQNTQKRPSKHNLVTSHKILCNMKFTTKQTDNVYSTTTWSFHTLLLTERMPSK